MCDNHENCNCGCNNDDDDCCDDDFEIMTLTLEDGSEIECAVIGVFPVDEKEYISLIPVNDIDSEDGEIYLYGFKESEDGEVDLISIESDEEYEKVAKVFDNLMDEEYGDDLEEDK